MSERRTHTVTELKDFHDTICVLAGWMEELLKTLRTPERGAFRPKDAKSYLELAESSLHHVDRFMELAVAANDNGILDQVSQAVVGRLPEVPSNGYPCQTAHHAVMAMAGLWQMRVRNRLRNDENMPAEERAGILQAEADRVPVLDERKLRERLAEEYRLAAGNAGGPNVMDLAAGQSGDSQRGPTAPAGALSAADWAAHLGLNPGATKKALERWRSKNPDLPGVIEQANRKPREPQYLYTLAAAEAALGKENLSRSCPAKKN